MPEDTEFIHFICYSIPISQNIVVEGMKHGMIVRHYAVLKGSSLECEPFWHTSHITCLANLE